MGTDQPDILINMLKQKKVEVGAGLDVCVLLNVDFTASPKLKA